MKLAYALLFLIAIAFAGCGGCTRTEDIGTSKEIATESMEKVGDTWHVKFTTKIDAPPDKVFEAFAQPERSHEFSPDNVLKSELVSQSGNTKVVDIVGKLDVLPPGIQGAEPAHRVHLLPRREAHHVASRSTSSSPTSTSEYKFEPADDGKGTIVTFTQTSKDKAADAGRVAAEGRAARDLRAPGADGEQGARARPGRRPKPGRAEPDASVKVTAARFLGAAAAPGGGPPPGLPEVAVAGRSNVGKSSLMNALLGRRGLARTSSTPGRTRQINFFLVNERLRASSTCRATASRSAPEAERRGWGPLVEGYLRDRVRRCAACVLLVDVRRGPRGRGERAARVPRARRAAGRAWSRPSSTSSAAARAGTRAGARCGASSTTQVPGRRLLGPHGRGAGRALAGGPRLARRRTRDARLVSVRPSGIRASTRWTATPPSASSTPGWAASPSSTPSSSALPARAPDLPRRHRPHPVRHQVRRDDHALRRRERRLPGGAALKLLVVACNTPSPTALETLREHVDVPVIGVVEPGVAAAIAARRAADASA